MYTLSWLMQSHFVFSREFPIFHIYVYKVSMCQAEKATRVTWWPIVRR